MAAGRHGGYRDNEFRGREAEFEVSRKELGYPKGDYDRIRNGDRDFDRDRVHDRSSRDRGRLRQKDVKEREVINGSYRSTSSRSDSGSSDGGAGRSGFSVRAVDREPGELSSESGSDGAIDSDRKTKNAANGNQSPVQSKKRKFSPIIWDRDEKEANRMSKSRNSSAAAKLPPPPPLPKSSVQSPNLPLERVEQVSPLNNNNDIIQSTGPSQHNPNAALGSHVDASESPVDIGSPPPDEERLPEQDARIVEEDEYVPTIRASRWATDADSPADEGLISDDDMPRLKKQRAVSQSAEMGGHRKSLTPEFGELKRDNSGGNRARSSDSDEHIRSSSRDSYQDNDLDKNDSMVVDKDRNYDGTSVSQSDTESEDEHDSRGIPEPALPPQRSVNMLQGCRSVDEFERLNRIDEGTYGVVYRARDKKTGEIVALKKVKMEKEREGFPLTSLREINILLSIHHPSIVDVKEVVVGSSLDSIFMVMEYMEHDLKALMETMKQPFSQSEVKCLMLQLLQGIKYLHDNWVLHRDLKTSNLLLNNRGELKICDFGLARQYGSPLKPYTHLVVTLWYRAPELLLGAKQYSTAIDMWSLGCIMAEMLSKEALFNGKTEVDQIDKIFKILGTPNETIWPGFSKLPGVKVNFVKYQFNSLRKKFPATSFTGLPVLSDAGFDLLNKLLTYDPEKRITADAALNHEWFREVPLPKSKEFMPTFPAQHAQDRRVRRVMKSPDPLEEQRRKELKQGVLGTGGLFG
ncbi:PREDICTED: cyclin-dependent kinase G-2 isoform X1 [Nicotiana attenuata]|uniref:cyclin-dependent kinase n=1 Tax=Nicotiana attenuata TaxID=49451 RepID=A0A314KK19_NICAT|nr:PREDICTED: cyclin-dependent kinase G-2 isoform X1 [Nicotiana attenuata]XP_019230070.1 PREDICTED: cyclin-dependent kinase G-2 isoform X1 [Nicotiana attenuata]XP_019230071.1 PREDICTED: cyclin-dependent kinase G-2 isoform X1 [Nicotiana attenuata]XP_019230072.1 PREDICTED: cyclin-dependent kinase G-2 isoform X1 [Nicotiana attenuata]XP_019230073.1 PREDICTED: cyclin-dependent kinase G-2 isoform X1 [Nicotiana attenuata]XP_019230074.1 PREDICTED: cyclin-dependent kinase G-2 isoform X1 [Nicotiana atte